MTKFIQIAPDSQLARKITDHTKQSKRHYSPRFTIEQFTSDAPTIRDPCEVSRRVLLPDQAWGTSIGLATGTGYRERTGGENTARHRNRLSRTNWRREYCSPTI